MSAGAGESAVAAQVAALRARFTRVRPEDLPKEAANGALVVDTRPVEQRDRDGALPGAIVVDRNVLEWRLDPTSPYRLPQVSFQSRVVLVCNEGLQLDPGGIASVPRSRRGHRCGRRFQGLVAAGVLPLLELGVALPDAP